MGAFEIRRSTDGTVIGWGDTDREAGDDTLVDVRGVGLVVTMEALRGLGDDPNHDLIWLDDEADDTDTEPAADAGQDPG